MIAAIRRAVTSPLFDQAIMAIIVVNAVTLGLETSATVMAAAGGLLKTLDMIFLWIFTVELALKLLVHGRQFPRDPWRIFDLAVVAIAWIPAAGPLSVLRALRILRVLRLVGMVPSLRRVIGGLLAALPGMGSIMGLLALVFYIFSVIATKLFGASFPEWFGSLGASAYTLFQVMTLESWSMGIVRPVMEAYPAAWLFFIPFIVATTFTVLNLFIGIIVSAMQSEHEQSAAEQRETLHADQEQMLNEIRMLASEVKALREQVSARRSADTAE
ncbi:MAG: voltage-gated sodium channel [Phyllobacteriaceae bacterium]|nr:voltage-gated sodium channel [Phyllobacteriaceae bacterium]MBA90254.1 voltage-gated sodium channel [Phyllobacteriaceae bacterium]